MKTAVLVVALLGAMRSQAEVTNLVANGSFEQNSLKPGVPDYWSVAGNAGVNQQLRVDAGPEEKRGAKLECTGFAGDGPDFHAMICQVGRVTVRKGQWYKFTFQARAAGIKPGEVDFRLADTRDWGSDGLDGAFTPGPRWEPFEFRFQAPNDLPAAASRLQFSFKSTGTLWLSDVILTESNDPQQWYPQISTAGVKNFVPNSSFECGGANWGSFTYGLSGWAGNLYRLESELDDANPQHGKHCLKIALGPKTLPIFYFDYYNPIHQPVRRVLAANQGWFKVQPGERLTLSAFMRANAGGVVAQMIVNEAPSQMLHHPVRVSTNWQRHEFSFVPAQSFLFIGAGLDLEESKRDTATLWLDAIQLERGDHATAYEPRAPVESFIGTPVAGNLFTNVSLGAAFTVRAFNNTDLPQFTTAKLTLTDFFDRTNFTGKRSLNVPPHGGVTLNLAKMMAGQRGFFRANWTTAAGAQTLRCAIIDPAERVATDSPFGFNHAYPWQFLVELARESGIVWWRDWSAKWQTVEPEQGRFDFQKADEQILRLLDLDGQVEVLLPFPSAKWSTSARREEVAKAAGDDSYLRERLPVAYPPQDLEDFGRYAAETVRHYERSRPRPITTYQVLNEPVYTDYALPQKFGYGLNDYLRILASASRAMKLADPQCRVVGGISAGLTSGFTRDFVTQGGLRLVDVFDLHIYDPPRPEEIDEESFAALENLMRSHGGVKPVWITEWGCYADDDPASMPQTMGDRSMDVCRWKDERAASEHIVKYAAVAFAHGARKIFFHAGTCGVINGEDAGGVIFEYGGAPRKMLPAIAAFTRLVGVPDEFVRKINRGGFSAYVFRVRDGIAAIAWQNGDAPRPVALASKVTAFDIMGNQLPPKSVTAGASPIYLKAINQEAMAQSLEDVTK